MRVSRIAILSLSIFICFFGSATAKKVSETDWSLSEISKTKDKSGDYTGLKPDTVVFKNGHRLEALGYNVESLGVLPKQGPIKLHLFRSSTCYECEPSIELIAFSTTTKNTFKLPYPGITSFVDPTDPSGDFEAIKVTANMGMCGPYSVVAIVESRHKKSMPLKFIEAYGLSIATPATPTLVKKTAQDLEAIVIQKLVTNPSDGCTSIAGVDTHQYQ